MQTTHSKYFYLFFYAVISLTILGPLLLSGAVLTLDMRFGPNVGFIPQFYGLCERVESVIQMPLSFTLWLINMAIPFWVWQKILFFLIFFLAGVGAHRLLPGKGASRYFAGLLYMINPFTYVRFLAGQWVVLAVYALTPFALGAFIHLLEERNMKNAVRVALLSTLVGIMYEHGFFLLFLTFLIIWFVKLLNLRGKAPLLEIVKYTVIASAIFVLLNAYWLIPLLTAPGTIVELIGEQDMLSFAPTHTSNLGVMFDIASMYGFWRGGYIYTKDILPFWWFFFALILFLSIYGFLAHHQEKEAGWLTYALATTGIISFLLAVGAASHLTRPLFDWLWRYIPFFKIFRDSQKFVALLCLAYAYLGGLGVYELTSTLKQQKRLCLRLGMTALVALFMITPIIYSFTIFGFYGELRVTDYPREWYELNDYINQDKSDFNVLFLPWHEFMDFSWLPNSDKRLGNPARAFFDKPVIQGDNIEMPEIYSLSTNPISRYFEFLLGKNKEINNLGELLSPLNVKYIILVNESDYLNYDFLFRQEDLTVALIKPGITLFKNQHPTARVYGVNGISYVKNLEEYLKLSKTQDVMENLYLIGEGEGKSAGEMQKLRFSEKSPVMYEAKGTQLKYTIFTVPQEISTNSWTYDGEKPVMNLGFMPSFASSPEGGRVVYTRFYYIYLPSHIISIITLTTVALFYLFKKPKEGPTGKK